MLVMDLVCSVIKFQRGGEFPSRADLPPFLRCSSKSLSACYTYVFEAAVSENKAGFSFTGARQCGPGSSFWICNTGSV